MKLSDEERAEVVTVIALARARGLNPVDELERKGLLWSQQRQNQIAADAVTFVAHVIETISPTRLGTPGTASDMRKAIVKFLNQMG